jgi:hypothetical protein
MGVLDIFSEYSLKIPQIYSNVLKYTRMCSNILECAQIYSNVLKYTRIYSIFPCRAGAEVLRAVRVGGRIDNPDNDEDHRDQ